MKKLWVALGLAAFAVGAYAADGSIVFDNREHTVSATVGDESCYFVGPIHDTVIVSCWRNIDQLALLRDADTLPVGVTRSGSFDNKLFTWVLRHTGPDAYTFEIHAGSTVLGGNL